MGKRTLKAVTACILLSLLLMYTTLLVFYVTQPTYNTLMFLSTIGYLIIGAEAYVWFIAFTDDRPELLPIMNSWPLSIGMAITIVIEGFIFLVILRAGGHNLSTTWRCLFYSWVAWAILATRVVKCMFFELAEFEI